MQFQILYIFCRNCITDSTFLISEVIYNLFWTIDDVQSPNNIFTSLIVQARNAWIFNMYAYRYIVLVFKFIKKIFENAEPFSFNLTELIFENSSSHQNPKPPNSPFLYFINSFFSFTPILKIIVKYWSTDILCPLIKRTTNMHL